MSVNNFRVIVHTIGFEPKTELGGTFPKLDKAQGRAKTLIESMQKAGQVGYVMVRNHSTKAVESVYWSTEAKPGEAATTE
jgi:enoyl-[acyl-carrier-protein] reductase (NADH)